MQNVNSNRSIYSNSTSVLHLIKSAKSHNDAASRQFFNIEKKLSILPVILMIAGTLGNTMAFYVLTRKKLRVQSTMLYFASLTIMDTISLYQWNFNFFYKYQLNSMNQNLENQSLFLCRYISFMAHFSMQTSAWILTIISIDRYLIVISTNWKQKFSKNLKFSLAVIVTVVLFMALLNLPVALFNGTINLIHIKYGNNSSSNIRKIECYKTEFIKFWEKITLIIECVLPLILMILFNGLLINKTYKSSIKLNAQQQLQQQQLNKKENEDHNKILKSLSISSNLIPSSNYSSNLNNSVLNRQNTKITGSCFDLGNMEKLNVASSYSNLVTINDSSSMTSKLSSLLKKNRYASASKLNSPDDPTIFHKKLNSRLKDAGSMQTIKQKASHKKLAVIQQSSYSLAIIPYICESNRETNSTKLLSAAKTSVNNLQGSSSVMNVSNTNSKTKLSKNHRAQNGRVLHVVSDRKTQSYLRNRRIVLMLTLLTISFAISTLPSSIFYTFLRPILSEKPYRRLLSMSFNLLRHLSHSFNFIIYFTSSSIIKQQLKETLREIRKKHAYKRMREMTINLFHILPFCIKKTKIKNKLDGNKQCCACKNNLNNNNNIADKLEQQVENFNNVNINNTDEETSMQISYFKSNKSMRRKSTAGNNFLDEFSTASPNLNDSRQKENARKYSQLSLNVSTPNNYQFFNCGNNQIGEQIKDRNFEEFLGKSGEFKMSNEEKIDFESITFNVPNFNAYSSNNNLSFKKKKRWF